MTRILVVDDVKLFRHMEATVLGWRGYTIEEASSGSEALEKIRHNPPDLVLLDYVMPGMDGHEVCSQIKNDPSLCSLPVIMVASSARDEDIRRAVQAGCDDYLTKPLDDASLLRKVEDLLGQATKRRFPRVSAGMQVSFEDFKGIFFEYARDISRSGVFIEMAEPLTIGTRLRLSFSLPPPFDHPILAYGRVVRISEGQGGQAPGVGVSFIHVPEASTKVIDALVAGQKQPEEETTGPFSRLSLQLDEPECDQPAAKPDDRVGALASDCVRLQDTLETMQRDHLRLSAMLALTEGLLSAATPAELLEAASEALANLLGAEVFGIFLHDADQGLLQPVASAGLPEALREHMPLDGPLLQAFDDDRVVLPVPAWPLDADGAVVLAAGAIPGQERSLGLVTVHALFPQKAELTLPDQQLLQMLCRHLGHCLESTAARQKAGPLDFAALLASLR